MQISMKILHRAHLITIVVIMSMGSLFAQESGKITGLVTDKQTGEALPAASAFIDSLEQMPDLDAIIAGENVSAPREIDLQYAVATALVGRAIRAKDSDNAATIYGHILNYAKAFRQKEMGVMLVSDMHRAIGQDIFSVPQFAAWSNAVADIMLYS